VQPVAATADVVSAQMSKATQAGRHLLTAVFLFERSAEPGDDFLNRPNVIRDARVSSTAMMLRTISPFRVSWPGSPATSIRHCSLQKRHQNVTGVAGNLLARAPADRSSGLPSAAFVPFFEQEPDFC
jgi:hypothetical protein